MSQPSANEWIHFLMPILAAGRVKGSNATVRKLRCTSGGRLNRPVVDGVERAASASKAGDGVAAANETAIDKNVAW
jgi:hypothetical protein